MEIRAERQGDYEVLVLGGVLDAASAPEFQAQVGALTDGGTTNLLVDMAGLSYVSSAGLRVFVFAAKKIHRASGHLGLVAPQEMVKNVFVMAALDKRLSFFADREEAIRELG